MNAAAKQHSECQKNTCVTPAPFYSHQIVYQSLCLALYKRGHKLTCIDSAFVKRSDIKKLYRNRFVSCASYNKKYGS